MGIRDNGIYILSTTNAGHSFRNSLSGMAGNGMIDKLVGIALGVVLAEAVRRLYRLKSSMAFERNSMLSSANEEATKATYPRRDRREGN